MTTTRFDQRPGPYGRCKTCDVTSAELLSRGPVTVLWEPQG